MKDLRVMDVEWNRRINYEFAYHTPPGSIKSTSTTDKQRCYLIVALIKLRNGSRISEVAKAFKA